MENIKRMISAPNLLNICIDSSKNGEYGGRIWYLYKNWPVPFSNTVDLIKKMDGFFDTLNYPEASTVSRTFYMEEKSRGEKGGSGADGCSGIVGEKGR